MVKIRGENSERSMVKQTPKSGQKSRATETRPVFRHDWQCQASNIRGCRNGLQSAITGRNRFTTAGRVQNNSIAGHDCEVSPLTSQSLHVQLFCAVCLTVILFEFRPQFLANNRAGLVSFLNRAPLLGNSLPVDVREAPSPSSFREGFWTFWKNHAI